MGIPIASVAGLQPITDQQLSEVTGQTFVSIDRPYHPDPAQNTSYTRINMGMDIEVQTNIDVLEVGRYDRAGESPGQPTFLSRTLLWAILITKPTTTKTARCHSNTSPMAVPTHKTKSFPSPSTILL
ncbi:hypothetical protein [Marinobacter litoralis]|uniref:hypothetical protein n=1 Tax=Marinobacter litoralis TaxID=187981 RepID=UPI0038737C82